MKRETVLVMLKKRLSDAKWSLKDHHKFNNYVPDSSWKYPKQSFKNLETDMDQLEYLIKCLKERK